MSNYDSLYLTGTQQVSLFPYQTLSSVYGNELLHGLFDPGVYSSGISVSNGSSNTILRISIHEGTTLMFKRQHVNPDDPTKTDIILGKIVITSANFIDMLKEDIWNNISTFSEATQLYVVADWRYGVTSSSERYVSFSLETNLSNIQAYDGTVNHKLIVATLSNHQWFISNYSNTNSNLYNYHISYDIQANRSPLKRLFTHNNNFNLNFASNGRSIGIGSGNVWLGNTLVSLTSEYSIAPPLGLTSYITSNRTNTSINIAGVESSYYQVDILRVCIHENTSLPTYEWKSFLVTGTGIGSTQGSSLGWANNSVSQQELMDYIQQFIYPVTGEGINLLISVRPRSSIPIEDGATNIIWPENCIIIKDSGIECVPIVVNHSRLKVPVWNASDLI